LSENAEGPTTLLICDDHKILTDALAMVVERDGSLRMIASPVHVPEEAIELCRLVRPRTAIPVHYEGWTHFGQGRAAIEREGRDRGGDRSDGDDNQEREDSEPALVAGRHVRRKSHCRLLSIPLFNFSVGERTRPVMGHL